MNFQNYFPQSYYQSMYGQPQPNVAVPYMPVQNQQAPQVQNQQIVLIPVKNENEMLSYPLAPNSSAKFINENEPYIYTKTMDAFQMDKPKIERYRLVKEEDGEQQTIKHRDP